MTAEESDRPPGGAGGDGRPALVDDLLDGDQRALARAITRIENRSPGYRDLVSALHTHTGGASVVGITGSPGAGKSTLVNELVRSYRDRGETVGVIAVDPSSPFTGGSVLGDRVRMGEARGDTGVFVRSMGARGQLGGVSTATADAVTALDAFGMDRIVVETVGAGQNEVDIVRTAGTVVVLVQPGAGDDVQMLKAGILEIGDVFVVNKADVDGADRIVAELEEMVGGHGVPAGHHGPDAAVATGSSGEAEGEGDDEWTPPVVETVATSGAGVADLVAALDDHRDHLERTGQLRDRARERYAAEIRRLLREDAAALVDAELDRHGGIEALAEAVLDRETDPYSVADEVLEPLADCADRDA